jgi:hypothetical protein
MRATCDSNEIIVFKLGSNNKMQCQNPMETLSNWNWWRVLFEHHLLLIVNRLLDESVVYARVGKLD